MRGLKVVAAKPGLVAGPGLGRGGATLGRGFDVGAGPGLGEGRGRSFHAAPQTIAPRWLNWSFQYWEEANLEGPGDKGEQNLLGGDIFMSFKVRANHREIQGAGRP